MEHICNRTLFTASRRGLFNAKDAHVSGRQLARIFNTLDQHPAKRPASRFNATAAAVQEAPAPPNPSESPLTSYEPTSSRLNSVKNAKPFSDFLTDKFSRQHTYLRVSVSERCNLRCQYCMPEEGIELSPKDDLLTQHEILWLAQLFVSQGVNKVRLTGGEPMVHPQILSILRNIGALKSQGLQQLAITTNGINLRNKLDTVADAGVTGLNLSLDTLDARQFEEMTRRPGFDKVVASIYRILDMKRAGVPFNLKVNAVIMRGVNDKQLIPFIEFTRDHDLEIRFIEYMPFGGNRWEQQKMMTYQEMLHLIRQHYPTLQKLTDHPSDASKTWHVPGFAGRVGFISSMTDHFCAGCNRLRITSDGNLKVCLHGNNEVSLRDTLRDDFNQGRPIDQQAYEALREMEMDLVHGRTAGEVSTREMEKRTRLLEVIGAAVKRKHAQHAGLGVLEHMQNRPMILIGG